MNRKGLMALAGGLIAVVIAASAAWACTEFAEFTVVGETTVEPATSLTVEGVAFHPGPVQIRWETASGPVLGSGAGPEFTVSITVPADASSGVHYLVAVQQGSPNPAAPLSVRASQTAPAAKPTSPSSPTASSIADAAAQAPSPSAPDDQPSAPALAAAPAGSAADERTSVASGAASPDTTLRGPSGTTDRPTASGLAAEIVAGAAKRESSARAGQSVEGSPARPAPEAAAQLLATGSARSASDDVWSGFAPAANRRGGPSLATPPGASGRTPLAPGLGLLVVGLVTLTGGFAWVAGRRRRAGGIALHG